MLITFLLTTLTDDPGDFIGKLFSFKKYSFLFPKTYNDVVLRKDNAVYIQKQNSKLTQYLLYINIKDMCTMKDLCNIPGFKNIVMDSKYIDTKTKKYIDENEMAFKNVRNSLTNFRSSEYTTTCSTISFKGNGVHLNGKEGLDSILKYIKPNRYFKQVTSFRMLINGKETTTYSTSNFSLEVINYEDAKLYSSKVIIHKRLWIDLTGNDKGSHTYLIPKLDKDEYDIGKTSK